VGEFLFVGEFLLFVGEFLLFVGEFFYVGVFSGSMSIF
jgi:hypothetical protein